MQSLVDVCGLKLSTHRWCTFGLKTTGGNPSAVVHRCASTFEWQSTPCQCPADAEHVHDLALRDPCCTAQRRHTYEAEAAANLLESAWICESVSGKSADSTVSMEGTVVGSDSQQIACQSAHPAQHVEHNATSSDSSRARDPAPESSVFKSLTLPAQSTVSKTPHNFCATFFQS